jgi:Tfp pilus assembly protein PilN
MMEINLLPWREQKAERAQRQMRIAAVTGGIAGFAIVMILHLVLGKRINDEARHIEQLESAWSSSHETSAPLPNDNAVASDLSGNAAAALLAAAAKSTINGICYQRIARDTDGLVLSGLARYPQSVFSALASVTAEPAAAALKFGELKHLAEQDHYQFVLREHAGNPDDGE